MADYSTQELMIIAAAREIRDGELVFVGMRLPITAYGVARLTHAPNAVGMFEGGVTRYAPAEETLYTMCDPANQRNAAWTTGLIQVMGHLQAGRVDAGFIGGAEIDKWGNINTSYIGGHEDVQVKLPGSGGAADIAAMSRRLIAIMNHEKRRLVERVSYITSPGYIDGEGELHLSSVHPGHTADEVIENTGWELKTAPGMSETPAPGETEMTALHQVDREGFWR